MYTPLPPHKVSKKQRDNIYICSLRNFDGSTYTSSVCHIVFFHIYFRSRFDTRPAKLVLCLLVLNKVKELKHIQKKELIKKVCVCV